MSPVYFKPRWIARSTNSTERFACATSTPSAFSPSAVNPTLTQTSGFSVQMVAAVMRGATAATKAFPFAAAGMWIMKCRARGCE